ncbi:MAG: hypothetical protein ACLFQT_10980 [Thiohalophilus sp.]
MHKRMSFFIICGVTLLLMSHAARAGEVSVPNSFQADTPAVAAEVNANFDAVATEVNDNAGVISDLQDAVAQLQSDLADAKTTIESLEQELATHESQISGINNSDVMGLEPYLTVDTVSDSRGPLVRLKGVNLQLVNGEGQTDSINGLGNLIVGYDAARDAGDAICSDGAYADQTNCENAGETWAQNHKSGSHNIVGGSNNSYSRYGGLVVGRYNVINRQHATVSGGYKNTSSGNYSSVSGGVGNNATDTSNSISGGSNNTTGGLYSSISGGLSNTTSGNISSVSGGARNTASGLYSSVSGGDSSTASGSSSSVSGGDTVEATVQYGWAAGTYADP